MPFPTAPPLTYRLRAPGYYQPNENSLWYPPEDSLPFEVDIFDQTLGALLSGENRYVTQRELWWMATMASFSVGSAANPPFVFELMEIDKDDQGNQETNVHQDKAVNGPNKFGTAQHPCVLKRAKYFAPGTEIVCRVSNLQNAANAIQVVLACFIRNLPK